MENNLVTSCRYKPVIIVPYSRQTVDFHRFCTKTRQNPDRTSESALKSDESFLYIRLRWPENKQKKSDWKHQLVCSRAFIFILIQLEQQPNNKTHVTWHLRQHVTGGAVNWFWPDWTGLVCWLCLYLQDEAAESVRQSEPVCTCFVGFSWYKMCFNRNMLVYETN